MECANVIFTLGTSERGWHFHFGAVWYSHSDG